MIPTLVVGELSVLLTGMSVAPGPLFFLLIPASLLEVSMVAAGFVLPTLVVENFVAIPRVRVLVSGIVNAIRSTDCTAAKKSRASKLRQPKQRKK